MKTALSFFSAFLFLVVTHAQVPETLPPEYIKTIEFKGSSRFGGTPIVQLGQSLTLEFDDLVGNEANYYYKISYYNFDWTPSTLAQSEYLEGFDNVRIKNYKNSHNTLQIYTHYTLTIPNEATRALKVSGNYMLEIYNKDGDMVFSRRFIVYENIASVQTQVKRSRNLNFINTKQVVNFTVSGGPNFIFKNPAQNLHTLIIKNNNLQNALYDLKPQYHMGNKLVYRYDQKSAFMGGNEFLYFDSKDVRAPTLNIKRYALKKIYNLYLYTDHVRADAVYTYAPDINGNFKVNTVKWENPDTESEYVWMHFYLKNNKPLQGGKLYIYGGFNNYALEESTLMTYNPKTGLYEGRHLFKQGFYNYKYVLKRKDGSLDRGFISGNFAKTENQYTVLVYYRAPGARYDRVIGMGRANSENISY